MPTTLGGSSVSVTVGSTTVPAFLYFASAGQINAVLPSTTPTGTGTITVTYNNQTSATAPITVVASSFGAFSVNEAGSGPGIITDANYVVNSLTHTAKPGQALILWGTGLGAAPDPLYRRHCGALPHRLRLARCESVGDGLGGQPEGGCGLCRPHDVHRRR